MELNGNFNKDFPFLSTIFMDNNPKPPPLLPQNHTLPYQFIHPNHRSIEGATSYPFSTIKPQNFMSFNPISPQSNTGYRQNTNPYILPKDMPPPTINFSAHIGHLKAAMDQETIFPTNVTRRKRSSVKKKPRKDRPRKKVTRAPPANNTNKRPWSAEEDRLLADFVKQYGEQKWSQVAKMIGKRGGKQCRERWHNQLRPNIRKEEWSEMEDKMLIAAHKEVGNKWAKIAKEYLPRRSENSIKNHWNATKRSALSRLTAAAPNSTNNNYNHHYNINYMKKINTNMAAAAAVHKPYSHLQNYIISLTLKPAPAPAANDLIINNNGYGNGCSNHDIVGLDKELFGLTDHTSQGTCTGEYGDNNNNEEEEESCSIMDMEMEALLSNYDVKEEMMLLTDLFPSSD